MTSSPSGRLDPTTLRAKLEVAYPKHTAAQLAERIGQLVDRHAAGIAARPRPWVDQRDVMLITYGDSIVEDGRAPLASLRAFLDEHARDLVSAVHILPFYPYSSDDGFSVIDYRAVNPALGTWDDVRALAGSFELIFDAVINHASRRSAWFEKFCAGDSDHAGYFIVADPEADYSQVVRPRALPLLTPVETAGGRRHVWTTFSDDQIDLNYANPKVLLEILDLLLFYAGRGARFIRLDAIGFMWKRPGTSCLHLPETHALIQVMRTVLDAAAPGTIMITETNVPHADNIGYFGDGADEAHLVYQFPLPPLVLHAFQTGSASYLNEWAASLAPTTPGTTFFNFLASHDGIGVRPVEGLLTREEVARMAERVQANRGLVSCRDLGDGALAPYELNVNYLDAVTLPGDDDALRARKFLAAQAILLAMVGVPGIYVHSLLGSRNDLDGVSRTGRNRSINRERLRRAQVERALAAPGSLRRRVLDGFTRLLAIRRAQPAFHPNATQRVLRLDDRLLALRRGAGEEAVLALVNVSSEAVQTRIPDDALPGAVGGHVVDLVGGRAHSPSPGGLTVDVPPYGVSWLAAVPQSALD